jgi:hypothetical protein
MTARDHWMYYPALALFLVGAVMFLSLAALGVYAYIRAPPRQRKELDEKHWMRWTFVVGFFGLAGAILFVLSLIHAGGVVSG